MESDVAYVRQQNEDEGAPPYSAQYAAFDQQPRGYTAYGDVQHLDSTDEGFAPPPHHEALQRPTRESAILQRAPRTLLCFQTPIPRSSLFANVLFLLISHIVIVSYWFGFVGALCVIFIGNKTTFILFHAWQGFFISTALWIICLCMVWSWIALLVAFLISAAILGGLTAVVRRG